MTTAPTRRHRAAWIAVLPTLALVGWGGWLAYRHQPPGGVRVQTRDGLNIRVDHWEWVHHEMEVDNGGFKMPSAMMPGMPAEGHERIHVELTLRNVGSTNRTVESAQLVAVTPDGQRAAPAEVELARTTLRPGEALTGSISFDVPEKAEQGAIFWEGAARGVALLQTGLPVHKENPLRVTWPALAADLPTGDASSGEKLFQTKACASCHGHPRMPRSNLVGPHLAGIATTAATRVAGKNARQYLYESITDPNAFIAPLCARDEPCTSPSTMPGYRSTLSLQEAADLVAFLNAQTVRLAGERP